MKRMTINTIAAIGVVLSAFAFAAGGASAEVKSLRGEIEIPETNATPDIFGVQENQRFGRAYRQQPPLVPHRIDKYEIDLKTNQCMSCHDWPFNVKWDAPKVSETHYRDRDGNRLDNVSRSRWFCTQCHVPQTDARPLVDNDFVPAN